MIVMTDGYRAAVIDMSPGTYSFVRGAERISEERYATEISDYTVVSIIPLFSTPSITFETLTLILD